VNVSLSRLTSRRTTAALVLLLTVVLAGGYLGDRRGVPFWTLVRDPGHLFTEYHPNSGALSILGCMVWAACAALLLLAGAVRRHLGFRDDVANAMLAFGAVAVVWGLDDALMFHDWWLEEVVLLPDGLSFGLLGLVVLAAGIPYRKVVLRTDVVLLALATAGFAISIAFDEIIVTNEVVEEFAKMWSIGLVALWSWRTARDVIVASVRPPTPSTEAARGAVTTVVDLRTGQPVGEPDGTRPRVR
jgi:hypothetical protein